MANRLTSMQQHLAETAARAEQHRQDLETATAGKASLEMSYNKLRVEADAMRKTNEALVQERGRIEVSQGSVTALTADVNISSTQDLVALEQGKRHQLESSCDGLRAIITQMLPVTMGALGSLGKKAVADDLARRHEERMAKQLEAAQAV